jgi:beta-fructofuranosidase
MKQAGWSGMMSLPRVLTLDPEGTLKMEMLPQTKKLRQRRVAPTVTAQDKAVTLPQATGEFLCHGAAGHRLEPA